MSNKFNLPLWAVLAATLMLPALAHAQRKTINNGSQYERVSLSFLTLDRSQHNKDLYAQHEKCAADNIGIKFYANNLGDGILHGQFPEQPKPVADPARQAEEAKKEAEKKGVKTPTVPTTIPSWAGMAKSVGNLRESGKKISKAPDSVATAIEKQLEAQNIGAKIIEIWSHTNDKGEWDVLNKRIDYAYSGTDWLAGKDNGSISTFREMFYLNYVMVLDFHEITTIAEYNRRRNIKTEGKVPEGLASEASVYVFRLNVDERLFEGLIKPNFDKPDILLKYAYDFEYVGKISHGKAEAEKSSLSAWSNIVDAVNGQAKKTSPDAPLYRDILNEVMHSTLFTLERFDEHFIPKSFLTNLKPITAPVGFREGIKPEQRGYLYAYNRNGKPKRIAVVRADRVGDNKERIVDTTGALIATTFYQVWGAKPREGCFFAGQKDIGIGVGVGYAPGKDQNALNFRAELSLTRLFGRFGGSDSKLDGLYLYGEIFFEGKAAETGYNSKEFTHWGFGFSKRPHKTRFINIEPFVGYYTFGDDSKSDSYVKAGFRLPMAIAPNFFFSPEIGYALASPSKSGEILAEDVAINILCRFEF